MKNNTEKCSLCQQEIKNQIVFKTKKTSVIFPNKPIFQNHLIIVPNKHVHRIDELSSTDLSDLNKIIKHIFESYSKATDCFGYNLFSNNGCPEIGQSIPHAHVHIYIRLKNETKSPFKIMNGLIPRENYSKKQWMLRKREISDLLNA